MGSQGIGYYIDPSTSQPDPIGLTPIPICLDSLVPLQACTPGLLRAEAVPWPSTSQGIRARRARLPCGKRKPHTSRERRRATAHFVDSTVSDDLCPISGVVEERWWPKLGLWAVEIANGNCWDSVEAAMVKRSSADILMLQETKRYSDPGIASATAQAREDGWNPIFCKAHQVGNAMGSGGGAVLTRKGTGIWPIDNSGIAGEFLHRLTLAWVDAVVRGGVNCMSIYLRSAEGMSAANQAILEQAAAALNAFTGPWITGGDWNIPPETLADSRWLDIVGGVTFATQLPTCNDNTYDYFVVHHSLAHAVVGVQRLENGGMNPHWASRLVLRGDARRIAIRELVKAPKVEGALPAGPSPAPPSYDNVIALYYTSAGCLPAISLYFKCNQCVSKNKLIVVHSNEFVSHMLMCVLPVMTWYHKVLTVYYNVTRVYYKVIAL